MTSHPKRFFNRLFSMSWAWTLGCDKSSRLQGDSRLYLNGFVCEVLLHRELAKLPTLLLKLTKRGADNSLAGMNKAQLHRVTSGNDLSICNT